MPQQVVTIPTMTELLAQFAKGKCLHWTSSQGDPFILRHIPPVRGDEEPMYPYVLTDKEENEVPFQTLGQALIFLIFENGEMKDDKKKGPNTNG